jgi:hypothetical protein
LLLFHLFLVGRLGIDRNLLDDLIEQGKLIL